MELRHFVHTFPPIINEKCRILLLGSVPSVKSTENGFYYMHPQNRFWKVLGALLNESLSDAPKDIKTEILLKRHIALYDSVYECDIMGSSDAKIINHIAADIPAIIKGTDVRHIFCNGAASYNHLTNAHPRLKSISLQLPSTSPANASYTIDKLIKEYSIILDYLK
jgi:hypoxanthine-DNA glycosylase